jgi:hypothetical protein
MAVCPNCHQQLPEISEGKFCPFCGWSLSGAAFSPENVSIVSPISPPPDTNAQGTPAEPPAAAAEPDSYVPWEDRQRLGFLPAFGQTWSDSVFHPVEFFRRLPKSGNLSAALFYALTVGMTAWLLLIFWEYLFWDSLTNLKNFQSFEKFDVELDRESLRRAALLAPVFIVMFVGIAASIFHICLLITGGARHGFEATFRGICYSFGPGLFGLFPFCGGFIALAWGLLLMVIAWRELHESSTGRVLLAATLPFLFCCGTTLALTWSLAALFNPFGP